MIRSALTHTPEPLLSPLRCTDAMTKVSPDSRMAMRLMVTRASAKRIKIENEHGLFVAGANGGGEDLAGEVAVHKIERLYELNDEKKEEFMTKSAVSKRKKTSLKREKVGETLDHEAERSGENKKAELKTEIKTEIKNETTKAIKTESKPQIKSGIKSEPNSKIKAELEDWPGGTKPPNVFRKLDIEDIELVPSSLAPKNWDKVYNLVVDMRAKFMSPVDTMGCERIPLKIRPNGFDSPRTFRFQLLISLMLLSQTKDEVNFAAVKTLDDEMMKRGFANGLCLEAVLATSEQDINRCIQKVGFHHRKAGYIKRACQMLHDNHSGDIPDTIGDIVALPGVGPKMGYLLLQRGWYKNEGIGVDVHIHRLAQMWGWVSAKVRTPEQTRLELEKWLPQSLWGDINPILVGFGQVICPPNYGNCDICTLGKQQLCKGANKKLVNAGLTAERIQKLQRQRGDLALMIDELTSMQP